MSTTPMRMKQQERSNVPLFFCHDAEDFAKLPHHGSSGTRTPPVPEEIFNWHWLCSGVHVWMPPMMQGFF